MPFEVRLTADAVRDLEEIKVAHVAASIEAAITALKHYPQRGRNPTELLALGIRDYRETFFKPYRIVYYVEGKRVYVSLIADGRRDMQALLARRLLGA
jgi:toxin ParE1/3/4